MKTVEEIDVLLCQYGTLRELGRWEDASKLRGKIREELRELAQYKMERRVGGIRRFPVDRRIVSDRRQS